MTFCFLFFLYFFKKSEYKTLPGCCLKTSSGWTITINGDTIRKRENKADEERQTNRLVWGAVVGVVDWVVL
jgi:hypothetical protein